ncbi:MAG: AraC family transcriptional regulator [Melioribacteraceae bacterium]|nr:AraC family transcriptional regulator [Melioribacteraceae bacterium]
MANRLLAILLFLYSVLLLRLLLWDLGYYTVIPHLLLLPISISFLMGPVHYLYCKYLISSESKFSKKDFLHFIPFLIYFLLISGELLKSKDELISLFDQLQKKSVQGEFLVFNWIITVHVLFYVTITLLRIQKFSNTIKQVFSSIEKLQLNWLRYITVIIGAGMVVFLIENTFLLGGYIISDKFALSNIIFSLYVIAIGYLGLLKSDIFLSCEFVDSAHTIPEIDTASSYKGETKYRRSGLTEERAKEILNDLLMLMTADKPYKDNSLTLNKLALILSVTPHNLSEVLNSRMNQNFFDFINKYRVDQVKSDLTEKSKNNLTLLSIAMDAGFNSKSSFNSIFKKFTGMTPTEYKSRHQQ